jgi:hypothetical protein
MAELSRAISQPELEYLRKTHEESLRGSGVILVFISFTMAAIAFRFGYLIFNNGSMLWGGILLLVGLLLFIAGIRTLVKKTNSDTVEFRPEIIQGSLNWRIVGSGKARRRQYFIGDAAVSLPGYWLKTLNMRAQPILVARVALPTFAVTANQYLPYTLLEIENGPSIDFECANSKAKRPTFNPWIWIGMVFIGFPTLIFLIVFFDFWRAGKADIINDTRAVFSSFLPSTYANVEEFKSAGFPKAGSAVLIKSAWRMPSSWVNGAPSDVNVALVSQNTRDRIVKERESFAKEYALAQQRAAEGRGNQPNGKDLTLMPGDAVVYLSGEPTRDFSLSYRADPITESLEKPYEITATFGSGKKPYTLLAGDKEGYVREHGYFLIAGVLGLIVFIFVAIAGTREIMRSRRFTSDVRKAYANQRGFQLL